ncbi:MAG: hypothetical protein WBA13_04225 [Microcoleaceae cyanobacterium]
MMSSIAYSNHPFFRFKSDGIAVYYPVSETKTVSSFEDKECLNSSASRRQKLTSRWVSTGKAYPKMELQWTVIEPDQD